MFILRGKPCESEIATDEIREKNNYREHSNIKAYISALKGSMPHKMA